MNDPDLMQLLAEVDPSRGLRAPQDAQAELLRQIVATPAVDPRLLARKRRERRLRQLSARTRLLVPVVGAAALAAALAVPAVLDQDPPAPEARPGAGESPSATVTDDPSLPVTKVKFAAAAVRVARENPRLLIAGAGWKVRSVEGFEPTAGETTFQRGPDQWVRSELDADNNALATTPIPNPDAAASVDSEPSAGYLVDNEAPQVSVNWYPRAEYDAYLSDRASEGNVEHPVLFGATGQMIAYSDTDHAVILPPEGAVFLEIRGSHLDRADFLAVLDEAAKVSVRDWLAAMPPEVVTEQNEQSRVQQVLDGVPTPPGFKRDVLGSQGALDSYQFGARVGGAVVCGWIRQWEQATAAGDRSAAARAQDALAGSRDWQFLKDMDAEGDYPEVVWEISAQVVAGERPEGYEGALGC